MQQKVKDFHKSVDTFRISHEAKLRELAYPFVKYAKVSNIPRNIDSYYIWKSFFVTDQNYHLVHDIEETYGTGFSLYFSSLRANNFELSESAKKVFSPLFHINNNSNYSIMDIHTDYTDLKCLKSVPELHEYLANRKSTNITGDPFNAEPYDERHEEYNKRGLNLFNIKTVEDFQKAFLLVDEFSNVKDAGFRDIGLKAHGGENKPNIPNYEPHIKKMRTCMRSNNYLNLPEENSALKSLGSNQLLNPKLLQLKTIANKQKTENILNVMRYNDFDAGFKSGIAISVLKEGHIDRLGTNFEQQVKILIESEENLELREQLREYYDRASNDTSISEEKLIEDILQGTFSFL